MICHDCEQWYMSLLCAYASFDSMRCCFIVALEMRCVGKGVEAGFVCPAFRVWTPPSLLCHSLDNSLVPPLQGLLSANRNFQLPKAVFVHTIGSTLPITSMTLVYGMAIAHGGCYLFREQRYLGWQTALSQSCGKNLGQCICGTLDLGL